MMVLIGMSISDHEWSVLGQPGVTVTLATANIDQSAREFAAVCGARIPGSGPCEVTSDGRACALTVCAFRFENVSVELVQSENLKAQRLVIAENHILPGPNGQ